MLIWAIEQSPACQVYERMGGKRVLEKTVTFAEKEILEVAYAWPPLPTIPRPSD